MTESKFQVQIAYTDLKSNETAQLPTFYQYLQKSQIHSFKLPVKQEKGDAALAAAATTSPAANAKSDVFASTVNQTPP